MKQLLKKIKQISMLLLVISLIGCENDDDNYPEVKADFTYEKADTGTVTFINTSLNSKNYFWTFEDKNGNKTSSTEINPIKTFKAGEYTVTLKATNVAGASNSVSYLIVISDAGAPIITLIGDTPINMTVGDDPYSDPGATAWDDVDGDISANIVVVGVDAVDVDTAGTYTITYNVSDAAGNAATERTRTVIVAAGVTCTAETTQSLDVADFNLTFQTDPTASITDDGAVMISVANPDSDNTVNSSCQVGKVTRNPDFQYANNQINFDTPLDFNDNAGFKMKVWTPAVGTTVTVKLEGTGATEVQATTTKANEWEELTFDFASSESGKYTKIVLFFNINSNTPGEFYIDDFMLYGTGTGGGTTCTDTNLVLPIDFDCDGIDYASKDSGDVAFEVIDNPELSGINATPSKVAKLVFDSNQPWENMNLNLDTPISFATDKSVKLKLFSSTARVVKLKFETGGAAVENDQNHTGSGWEELTFTLASAESYSNLILFVDGGLNTVGTFYIDDIEQVAAGGGNGGDCPTPPAGDLISNGDFEAGESCWELIDNGGMVTISSAVSSGSGSKSAQIQTAPLKNPGVKQQRFAVGIALPNTEYIVTFDIKADASTPLVDGAVFQAFVFSEGADGGTTAAVQHPLVQGLGSVSTSWETKTYTFTSGAAAANVEGGFSFLAELVCGGAETCGGIINIDNVSIKLK